MSDMMFAIAHTLGPGAMLAHYTTVELSLLEETRT